MTETRKTILIVDDEAINIRLLREALKEDYRLLVATNGEKALRQLEVHDDINLVLLDVNMPGISGIQVLDIIKKNPEWQNIPIIFVTAMDQEGDEADGLSRGAVDYITKPISMAIVRARVGSQLLVQQAKYELSQQNKILEQRVAERTKEISETQEVIIHSLTSLAEARDKETGKHILRTQHYVKSLANLLRPHPLYQDYLAEDSTIDAIFKTAPLHDIGKVGIPDNILLKPGKLTAEEFEIMKTHAQLGGEAMEKAQLSLSGNGANFLKYAKEIAYSHHEKWDGSGYPKGLVGEQIPISGRLMAIADVYDALISVRCYKPAFSHEESVEIMVKGRGSHFDPIMLDHFIENSELFRAIAIKYADGDESTEK